MPIPTAYSDASLAAFMVVELGPTADVLGWVPGTPRVEEAVSDSAVLLDSTIAAATDMAALRAVARLCIWRMAEGALVPSFDISVDNESLKRSQMWDHAKAMVTRYEGQCATLGIATGAGSGMVYVHSVTRSEDPYALPPATAAEF